ncbi:MAG: hemolysin III family protein [Ruminococcaceae bacterium]|nr:hemolysin III family protein [Oscillospiraceae bacterium]
MKRTKLSDRLLPVYSKAEETMNTVTHIVGGGMAVVIAALCILKALGHGSRLALAGCLIYGISMILLYTMSSVYHGLGPGTAKKVMQVLDHCTIYLLIAGTYSAVLLAGIHRTDPGLCWGLFSLEWGLTALAVTLTAIDLKKYRVFSMVCYIGMGWAILPFAPQAMAALDGAGFGFLLAGGIAYTIGAVLYGLGKTKKWMHSVFHIFVVLGSALQFISIFFYTL